MKVLMILFFALSAQAQPQTGSCLEAYDRTATDRLSRWMVLDDRYFFSSVSEIFYGDEMKSLLSEFHQLRFVADLITGVQTGYSPQLQDFYLTNVHPRLPLLTMGELIQILKRADTAGWLCEPNFMTREQIANAIITGAIN